MTNKIKILGIYLTNLIFLFCRHHVFAQNDKISGTYIGGKKQVTVQIKSWGEDCGPKPKSYSTGGGEEVKIELRGDNLYFSNGNSTKKCWSANTRLRRLSAVKRGNKWTTICETPENDSRYEHGEYTVEYKNDTISFTNRSTYNWQLRHSLCRAIITIRKTYTKQSKHKQSKEELKIPSAYIDTKYPEIKKEEKCKPSYKPEKVIITPSNVTLGAGKEVCFSVYAVDSSGCRFPVTAKFSVAPPANVKLGYENGSRLKKNCFIAGKDAALSEGTYTITALTKDNKSAVAKVTVKFSGIEDLIAVNLTPATLEEDTRGNKNSNPTAIPPVGFVEIPVERGNKNNLFWILLLIIIASMVTGSGVIIFITVTRIQRARRKIKQTQLIKEDLMEELSANFINTREEANKDKKAGWMQCEVCKREFKPGHRFCPFDGSKLKPYNQLSYKNIRGGMICPSCGRGYPRGTTICRQCTQYLIPLSVYEKRKEEQREKEQKGKQSTGKICPVCNTRYEDGAEFCGNDGNRLIPIQ